MVKMNKDIITLYDENDSPKEYKLLMVIDKEFKYIIYTDIDNQNIKKNLYAIKIKDYSDKETIPIDENEWNMIENQYKKIINT